MSVSKEQFKKIKSKYQYLSSWAIWATEGETPKSNVGDLTILDPDCNKNLLSQLNTEVVFVALNISRGDIKTPFGNFHDHRPCLLYTSPSPRDATLSRMPSSA